MEMGKGDVECYSLFFLWFVPCRLWRVANLSCSCKAWVIIGNVVEEHAIVFIKLPKSNCVKNLFLTFPYMEIKLSYVLGETSNGVFLRLVNSVEFMTFGVVV